MNIYLLDMLQVSDSAFPIGAFTLSNGLETFVQANKLSNAKELEVYIDNVLSLLPYSELGFFAKAYHDISDSEHMIYLDQLYSAYKAPEEVRQGSIKLCQRFLKIWIKIEQLSSLTLYKNLILQKKCCGHHALALAFFVRDKGLEYKDAASIYAYSITSGIITNAVKSVPLSQLDGQVILNKALKRIVSLIDIAKNLSQDELGICGAAFDIYAMQHETLYSRLYMS